MPGKKKEKKKDKKERNPRRRIMKVLGSISIVLLSFLMVFLLFWQPNVGVWGEHYTVEDHHISTYNGWELDVISKMNYSVSGIVLGERKYEYTESGSSWSDQINPTMLISPMDIFIGTEDVAHNIDNYPYTISHWEYKIVWWNMDRDHGDVDYFRTHVDNNHVIAGNENVYNALLLIEDKDNITLTGELVTIRGRQGSNELLWDSDVNWGDNGNQVWLVDSIDINGVTYNEYGEYNFIPPFVIGRFWMQIFSAVTSAIVISTLAAGTYFWERGRDERRKANKARTLVSREFKGRARTTKVCFDDVGSSTNDGSVCEKEELKFIPCPQCGEQTGMWEPSCLVCGAPLK